MDEMATYKTEGDPVDIWLHIRSFATSELVPFSGQGLLASYDRKDIKMLTEALGRIIRLCVDKDDAEATGCDLDRQRDTQRAVLDLREYPRTCYHLGRVLCAQSTTPKDFAFFGVVSGRYWARTSDP